jgi:hypothetical protein
MRCSSGLLLVLSASLRTFDPIGLQVGGVNLALFALGLFKRFVICDLGDEVSYIDTERIRDEHMGTSQSSMAS